MIRTVFMTCLFTFVALVDEQEIRIALERCRISITKLAVYFERDRSNVERQLRDERPLHHRDLAKLPITFHRWYHFLMLMKVGLPEELRQAAIVDTAMREYEHQLALFEESTRKERA